MMNVERMIEQYARKEAGVKFVTKGTLIMKTNATYVVRQMQSILVSQQEICTLEPKSTRKSL